MSPSADVGLSPVYPTEPGLSTDPDLSDYDPEPCGERNRHPLRGGNKSDMEFLSQSWSKPASGDFFLSCETGRHTGGRV